MLQLSEANGVTVPAVGSRRTVREMCKVLKALMEVVVTFYVCRVREASHFQVSSGESLREFKKQKHEQLRSVSSLSVGAPSKVTARRKLGEPHFQLDR